MRWIYENNLIPEVSAIFVQVVRTHYLEVWKLFIYPSLGDFAHVYPLLDVDYTYVLWPPSCYRPLLSHAPSAHPCPHNNNALLCFVAEPPSPVKSTWPLYAMDSGLCTPCNGLGF